MEWYMDIDRGFHEIWSWFSGHSCPCRNGSRNEVSPFRNLVQRLIISTPSAIGIIATHFHGRARSTAFACFSAGAPVGGGLGLVLGGVLTAYSQLVPLTLTAQAYHG